MEEIKRNAPAGYYRASDIEEYIRVQEEKSAAIAAKLKSAEETIAAQSAMLEEVTAALRATQMEAKGTTRSQDRRERRDEIKKEQTGGLVQPPNASRESRKQILDRAERRSERLLREAEEIRMRSVAAARETCEDLACFRQEVEERYRAFEESLEETLRILRMHAKADPPKGGEGLEPKA